MLLYELVTLNTSDMVFSPLWRQGAFVTPFCSRLGVVSSSFGWSLSSPSGALEPFWSFEGVVLAHLLLAGLLALSSSWHWSFADLDLFVNARTGFLVLDLIRIFGIHLCLASLVCFSYGLLHLSADSVGMWTSDVFGLTGCVRSVKPAYSILSLFPSSYGAIPANHIVSGYLGLVVGLWHLSSRPSPSLYSSLGLGNLESVLSSSIASVFFIAFLVSSSVWYSCVTSPIELLGPSRYTWDNAYFSTEISSRVKKAAPSLSASSWDALPDKIVFFDYIGSNPAKGGLFRSGPMHKGDGVALNWLGHANFNQGSLALSVRRMPTFFETFPVLLIDSGGTLRADIPFRRAESLYSIEQCNISVSFYGGVLSGTTATSPSTVKNYARKAQFGETFTFDRRSTSSDGVFRTSPRGWYTFSHVTLACIFFFGHLWHGGRSLFRRVWTGVYSASSASFEYGRNEKLGDVTSGAALRS
jgi:photosystem II CP47 chlorophyll apoprotein